MITKIFEKTYENINDIKQTGIINSRIFKKKRNKFVNQESYISKKNIPETEQILNVNTENNNNIVIDNNYLKNKNKNTRRKIKTTDQNRECFNKINKKMLSTGVFKLLFYIVKAQLKKENITDILELYILNVKTEMNIYKKRRSKTPFTKWYIKGYYNKSDFNKIADYILGFTKNINKNLKCTSKKYKIIYIEYT